MTENVPQCCYTNVNPERGRAVRPGWQPVAVSDNIPPAAYKQCVKLQNANSTIRSAMVDEDGRALNILELHGDGTYLYMLRTQYGLLDRVGRPNMFSHAYIFSWKDETVLDDPNTYLTISRSNFKDNEADAVQSCDQMPDRVAAMSLEEAMEKAGLNADTYPTLIRCVYAQRELREPLYIQWDSTEEQLRALLFCLYYGLPRYLRRMLYVASAEGNQLRGKNVVFTSSAEKHTYHLDPATGNNSVLNDANLLKLQRYGYIDYVSRHYREEESRTFFKELEERAVALGSGNISDELILRLAFQSIRPEEGEETSLEERVTGAINSNSYGSEAMSDYIAELLEKLMASGQTLNAKVLATLERRIESPSSKVTDQLLDTVERYKMYRFSVMSREEAVKELDEMPPERFEEYSERFIKTEEGRDFLDFYYAAYLRNNASSWETIDNVLTASKSLMQRPQTTGQVRTQAWKLFDEAMEAQEDILGTYNRFVEILGTVVPGELPELEEEAKKRFWDKMYLRSIPVEKISRCEFMRIRETPGAFVSASWVRMEITLQFGELVRELESAEGPDTLEIFYNDVRSFFHALEKVRTEGGRVSTKWLEDAVKAALEDLEEMAEMRFSQGDAKIVKLWIETAAVVDKGNLMTRVIDLWRQLKDPMLSKEANRLRGSNFSDVRSYQPDRNGVKVFDYIERAALETCRRWETATYPVPLDVWLTIGRQLYGDLNCMDIFDTLKPQILMFDTEQTAQNSSLLKLKMIRAGAEEYVRRNGEESRVVGLWLKAIQGPVPEAVVSDKKGGRGSVFNAIKNFSQNGKGNKGR